MTELVETAPAAHPLDRLTEAESAAAVAVVRADGRFSARMRFGGVNLAPPAKPEVLGFVAGTPFSRDVEVVLLNTLDGSTHELVVSLNSHTVTRWERLEGVQPALLMEEFFEAERAIRADPGFRAAMARRGITDVELATIDPWSAGHYGDPLEDERRLLRGLVWVHDQPGDNQYARPVDGISVLVDLATLEVVRIDDERVLPVPPQSGEWSTAFAHTARCGVQPLEIVQPDGPSFTVSGDRLNWQNWDLRIGWNSREGLVLHTVTYTDGDEVRPVLYQASLCEMTVPYGDPSPTQARKNAFDVGEYGLGTLANSLRLGCDCLGEIRYLDAHVCDADGQVRTIAQAICIHEEDVGISWKHTDLRTDHVEVRRLRRLVVSFIATVGNYDYGIYWYLYQDGRIENEIKLTGILSTAGLDDGERSAYGTTLAPNLYGPNHQHFFCTRLDMMIDGIVNRVVEVDVAPAPTEQNPWGNAFAAQEPVLATELAARRRIDPLRGRFWKVINPSRRNATGANTGYKLIAGENALPFATDDSSIRQRAGFLWHHLWVTPYRPDERWPAGTYPNQHRGGDGLPRWTDADRPLTDTDLVLWYVMGHTHLPSPEDWPVMPVACIGFTLKPSGFFDRNPALDLPPSTHCH